MRFDGLQSSIYLVLNASLVPFFVYVNTDVDDLEFVWVSGLEVSDGLRTKKKGGKKINGRVSRGAQMRLLSASSKLRDTLFDIP